MFKRVEVGNVKYVNMPSEIEVLKTNEFLRRRKLRIQQVREQSKEIAKRVRQRAKQENLRNLIDLDAKKRKEYIDHHEKIVNQLETLYVNQAKQIGSSHQSASCLDQEEPEKLELSRERGKAAAAQLRLKKQQDLDRKKDLLERKIRAREIANEVSRDKLPGTKKVQLAETKSKEKTSAEKDLDKTVVDSQSKQDSVQNISKDQNVPVRDNDPEKRNMETQWETQDLPNECEPSVPKLQLKDITSDTRASQSEIKRINLFSVSDEMPSSLRGGLEASSHINVPAKSSLNLVSEYLQTRSLNLRESQTKPEEDMASIRRTLLFARSSRSKGTDLNDICQVIDNELVHVPSWHPESSCARCVPNSSKKTCPDNLARPKESPDFAFEAQHDVVKTCPINRFLKETEPCKFHRTCSSKPGNNRTSHPHNTKPKTTVSSSSSTGKKLVTIYNHTTRDRTDIPLVGERLVIRESEQDEDAYSQALRESSKTDVRIKEDQKKKTVETRNKVAMSRQNVEKEYHDTINFLNSMSKAKQKKPMKKAYMDEHRQNEQREIHQKKMQQEYNKIEKEFKKHGTILRGLSDEANSRDHLDFNVAQTFMEEEQYSWVPVPDRDVSLTVHKIPNTIENTQASNKTKPDKVVGYHEYRSRHKHTPPTKENSERPSRNKHREAYTIEHSEVENSTDNSAKSDSSSADEIQMRLPVKKSVVIKEKGKRLSDSEKIIIYKLLDSDNDEANKKSKSKSSLIKGAAKSIPSIEKELRKPTGEDAERARKVKSPTRKEKSIKQTTLHQLNEGIYKVDDNQGENISSHNNLLGEDHEDYISQSRQSRQSKRIDENVITSRESEPKGTDKTCTERYRANVENKNGANNILASPDNELNKKSVPTSTPQEPTTDKIIHTASNVGFVKLINNVADDDNNKFYIGASGFLKDDNYEVVIQLRKKSPGSNKGEDVKEVEKPVDEQENIPNDAINTGSKNESDVKNKLETQNVSQQTERILNNGLTIIPEVPNKIPNLTDLNLTDDRVVTSDQQTDVLHLDKATSQTRPQAVPNTAHATTCTDVTEPTSSTYTQTGNRKDNEVQPIFVRLSSSTSTTYMSPPESILPKFMKRDYNVPFKDVCHGSPQHLLVRGEKIVTDPEYFSHRERKCKNCQCKCKSSQDNLNTRQNRPKNRKTSPIRSPGSSVKSKKRVDSPSDRDKIKVSRSKPKNKFTQLKCNQASCKGKTLCDCNVRGGEIKTTQKKTVFHSPFPIFEKLNNKNSKKYKQHNFILPITTEKASLQKLKRDICQKKQTDNKKSKLNPVLKTYINDLLTLNKDGLRALEIAALHCSSITTPGSSIINTPTNINPTKHITLKDIKHAISPKYVGNNENTSSISSDDLKKLMTLFVRPLRKKRSVPYLKVKNLNISKTLFKTRNIVKQSKENNQVSGTQGSKNFDRLGTVETEHNVLKRNNSKFRSKSSPSPRKLSSTELRRMKTTSDIMKQEYIDPIIGSDLHKKKSRVDNDTATSDSGTNKVSPLQDKVSAQETAPVKGMLPEMNHILVHIPCSRNAKETEDLISAGTQTNQTTDDDLELMKLAENKLQNMEKIADLTEKCTKRLSNLAKVLEEVRKNKSTVYTHISTTDTSSELEKVDKNIDASIAKSSTEIRFKGDNIDTGATNLQYVDQHVTPSENESIKIDTPEYIPMLSDIPKPLHVLSTSILSTDNKSVQETPILSQPSTSNINQSDILTSDSSVRLRTKPPPVLSRVNLKNNQEILLPHELSTVLEVDSPMSIKSKRQSMHINDSKNTQTDILTTDDISVENKADCAVEVVDMKNNKSLNTVVLQKIITTPKRPRASPRMPIQMMDLSKFNEIMLKPFISVEEYAKQCNMGSLHEGSTQDEFYKAASNDEMSSLPSDGSLPDVISELLKRNVISEPFKYDSMSNVNSTTGSSDSTLSILALAKAAKDRKKPGTVHDNKENVVITETSDTLSMSSNPDLEKAFKKLGMGWASSTLKKTKQTLALSSSTSTSNSSISHKYFPKKYDKVLHRLAVPHKASDFPNTSKPTCIDNTDNKKNVEQQTSLDVLMVNEFLAKELADKITFMNTSNNNNTEEHFTSLYSTKLPNETDLQLTYPQPVGGSGENLGTNTRQRTSTPVQLYKSKSYNTSISSNNNSNGFFSNMDDLSSVKMTSSSIRNHSSSDKDELTIPNYSLRLKKDTSDYSC